MRKLLLCAAAAAAFGCIGGCGPSTTTFHNFLVSQVTIDCQWPYNCCGAAPILTRQFGPDYTSCVNNNTTRIESEVQVANIEAGLANGNLHYDKSIADNCISQLQTISKSCASPLETPSSCFVDVETPTFADYNNFSMITGNIAVGDPCGLDATTTCVAGAGCLVRGDGFSYVVPPGTTDSNQPRCLTFANDGDPCFSAPCAPGLVCKTSIHVCHPPTPDGQGCTQFDDCASDSCTVPTGQMSGTCDPGDNYTMCGTDML